jgi:hypothetical protein
MTTDQYEIRVLAPTAVTGSGFLESSFDIMFDDDATYQRVKNSDALTREVVAKCYNLPASDVKFFYCNHAYSVKASIPRLYFQGDLRDSDGHGGQQYALPKAIEIQLKCLKSNTYTLFSQAFCWLAPLMRKNFQRVRYASLCPSSRAQAVTSRRVPSREK